MTEKITSEDKNMEVAIEGIKKDIVYIREGMDNFLTSYKELDKRVQTLENWKLVFVAKFTTYATIGLIIGSFLSQVFLKLLSKYI